MATGIAATVGGTRRPATARLSGRDSGPFRVALVQILMLSVGIAYVAWALLNEEHLFYGSSVETFVLVGLICVVVGVWLWSRRPRNGTGALLVIVGELVFAAAIGNTSNRWLGLLGYLTAEAPIAALTHVVFAFPAGKLPDVWSKRLVVLAYVSSIGWQIPIFAFGADSSSFRWLHVAGHPSWAMRADDAQSIVSGAILVGATWLLVQRWRVTRPLAARRVVGVAYGYGVFTLASFPVSAQIFRRLAGWSIFSLFEVQQVIVLGVPFVFAAAVLSGALARTVEIEELAGWLGLDSSHRPRLRDALSVALGDPTLELLHELAESNSFVDGDGTPHEAPVPDARRGVVRVGGPSGRAVIVYDAVLIGDSEPVEAAGRVVALAIDNERVTAELLASQAALRASRLRILEHGEQQRRQLAQDLHDGLQGRLVLAAIQAGRLAADGGGDEAARLRDDLAGAVNELRQLVHGVLPPSMMERGLFSAVEDLVDRVPLLSELDLDPGEHPLPWAVASAGYFIIAEALANTIKHAHATRVAVSARVVDDVLRLRVHDDGIGGVHRLGTGLRGIADRAATLAGQFNVDSPVDRFTTITVELPCGS